MPPWKFSELRNTIGLSNNAPLRASTVIVANGETPTKGANKKLSIIRQSIVTTYQTTAAIPPGAVLAVQAKDLAALANGTAVANWGPLTQATSGRRPVFYSTGGYNNGRYVSCTAALNQNIYLPDLSSFTMNTGTNQGYTFFGLFKIKTSGAAAWQRLFHGEEVTNNTGDFMNLAIRDNISYVQTRYGPTDYVGLNPVPNTINIPGNTWVTLCMRVTTSAIEVYRNNILILTLPGKTLPNTAIRFVLNGNNWNTKPSSVPANSCASADWGAFFLYDRPLLDSQITQLYQYVSTGMAT